ncbi:ferredoxin [Actinomadura viridis]|uniref:Ferredoxin n=1 Tax=Actinomadura viridis TaxID=58110 RepID=A0A931GK40_9ACTN|nr:ferredoxin [Actinomadura viridis]MBG6086001.1 ferredoxin [Actinomadura viridis]
MRIVVDLALCQDHGQCVFSAPQVFSLDENGKLSFRDGATDTYISADLDESLRDDVEEAADACPLQAIEVEG